MTTATKMKRLRIVNTHDERTFEVLGFWFPPGVPVVVEVGTGRQEIALRANKFLQIEYLNGAQPYRAGPGRGAPTPARVVAVEDAPEPDAEPAEQRPASGGARVTVGSGESAPSGR